MLFPKMFAIGLSLITYQHRFETYYIHRVIFTQPDKTYQSLGTLDSTLTKACRKGIFLPKQHAEYILSTKNGDLDIAWSNKNLYDRTNLAQPGKIYYFLEAGYYTDSDSNGYFHTFLNQECEVYIQ